MDDLDDQICRGLKWMETFVEHETFRNTVKVVVCMIKFQSIVVG